MMFRRTRRGPTTTEVYIRKAENGVVVEVEYPDNMFPDVPGVFSSLNKGLAGISKKQEEDGGGDLNPQDIFRFFGEIEKNLKPKDGVRKPREEYVFTSINAALDFIREVFESSS